MSARILAIVEHHVGISPSELDYQLERRTGHKLDDEDLAQLLQDQLLAYDEHGILRITDAGRRWLDLRHGPAAARAAQAPPEPKPEPSNGSAPASPPEAQRFALPDHIAPRRQRNATRAGQTSLAFTEHQLLERVHWWFQATGAPPAKSDWIPAQARRLQQQAQARVDRWAFSRFLYEHGDFPSEAIVRRRFGSLNALLALAGYEPRPTGRPRRDHPSTKTVNASDETPAQRTTRAMRAVDRARENDDRRALRNALYRLAELAALEADEL